VKIALGDLRHKTLGKHSALIPIGIGLIASYCNYKFNEKVDIWLCDDPEEMLEYIDEWKPDVIGLSNYMWNAELNRIVFESAREKNEEVVCVAGGPEFPIEFDECQNYLRSRPEIDFYVALEGEIVFSALIEKLLSGDHKKLLKANPIKGLYSISPAYNKLVYGGDLPRNNNLDEIPSPYLTGMFEEWLNGEFIPAIQTSRGCPYRCGYCRAGANEYSNVYKFDLERVKNELTYIAKRISKFSNIPLYIFDSNFGIYTRDELIAEHIASLQEEYAWPNSIVVDTVQVKYDRVARMAEKMNNKMNPLASVQTLNMGTIDTINRQNISKEKYKSVIQDWYLSRGLKAATELILPLPCESIDSYMEGVKFIFEAGVETITTFTWMLLPGTELASKQSREKYGIKSAFRIIPRQFGEYRGKKCFEIEEVCYETSTLSFDEYVKCRGFAYICFLFARQQYDILARHLSEFSIDTFDFFDKLFIKLESEGSEFSRLFNDLLQDTRDELHKSHDSIYEEFTKPENYKRLMEGEVGDNLFRKYLAKTLSSGFSSSLGLAYGTLEELAKDAIDENQDKLESLKAAKQWMLVSRDFSQIFYNDTEYDTENSLSLPYDISAWYSSGENGKPLWEYKTKVDYTLFWEKDLIDSFVPQIRKRYGNDPEYLIGKAMSEYAQDVFWRKCEYQTQK